MYLGHEEHLDQVAVGHEELGDEVDVVVARRVSQLRRRGLAWPELVVKVGEVERCTLSSVVVVTVHVQDLTHSPDQATSMHDAIDARGEGRRVRRERGSRKEKKGGWDLCAWYRTTG